METHDNKTIEVHMGNTKEDIKARETIISDVYRRWYETNPSKAVFNTNLNDNINVRYLSITETMRHAAKNYLSTLAVLQLDIILKSAYQVGKPSPIKMDIKNQSEFSEMIIMECPLVGIGTAKLTVGVKKKTGMKIQYCITAIKYIKKTDGVTKGLAIRHFPSIGCFIENAVNPCRSRSAFHAAKLQLFHEPARGWNKKTSVPQEFGLCSILEHLNNRHTAAPSGLGVQSIKRLGGIFIFSLVSFWTG